MKVAENEVPSLEFITKSGEQNPKDASLQAKCLRLFMRIDKPDSALQMASNLAEHSSAHHKAGRALDEFKKYAGSAKFTSEDKLKHFNDTLWPKFTKERCDDK